MIIPLPAAAAQAHQVRPGVLEAHFGALLARTAGCRSEVLHHGRFTGGPVLLQVGLNILTHPGIPAGREAGESRRHMPALGIGGHIIRFRKAQRHGQVGRVLPLQPQRSAIIIAPREQHGSRQRSHAALQVAEKLANRCTHHSLFVVTVAAGVGRLAHRFADEGDDEQGAHQRKERTGYHPGRGKFR